MGGEGVKYYQKLSDVIYRRPRNSEGNLYMLQIFRPNFFLLSETFFESFYSNSLQKVSRFMNAWICY
jgi:hypothetical protein